MIIVALHSFKNIDATKGPAGLGLDEPACRGMPAVDKSTPKRSDDNADGVRYAFDMLIGKPR